MHLWTRNRGHPMNMNTLWLSYSKFWQKLVIQFPLNFREKSFRTDNLYIVVYYRSCHTVLTNEHMPNTSPISSYIPSLLPSMPTGLLRCFRWVHLTSEILSVQVLLTSKLCYYLLIDIFLLLTYFLFFDNGYFLHHTPLLMTCFINQTYSYREYVQFMKWLDRVMHHNVAKLAFGIA